tara:strand:+ start:210 stop:833 length:624 start_codon:yes stop_codon:yes gene_type:complete
MNYSQAKKLFGNNIIGPDEFTSFPKNFKFQFFDNSQKIDINISGFDLSKHILIYGPKFMEDGTFLNIKKMYDIFGKKYTKGNIIFYNQDWYLSEKFAKTTLNNKWYLVQKEVSNKSRGFVPKNQFKRNLPSAVLCSFLFFSWWIKTGEILWSNDYVWCSDFDSFGDQIYVGKYKDLNNNERSGFSIHRHLSIKENYGCIKSFYENPN